MRCDDMMGGCTHTRRFLDKTGLIDLALKQIHDSSPSKQPPSRRRRGLFPYPPSQTIHLPANHPLPSTRGIKQKNQSNLPTHQPRSSPVFSPSDPPLPPPDPISPPTSSFRPSYNALSCTAKLTIRLWCSASLFTTRPTVSSRRSTACLRRRRWAMCSADLEPHGHTRLGEARSREEGACVPQVLVLGDRLCDAGGELGEGGGVGGCEGGAVLVAGLLGLDGWEMGVNHHIMSFRWYPWEEETVLCAGGCGRRWLPSDGCCRLGIRRPSQIRRGVGLSWALVFALLRVPFWVFLCRVQGTVGIERRFHSMSWRCAALARDDGQPECNLQRLESARMVVQSLFVHEPLGGVAGPIFLHRFPAKNSQFHFGQAPKRRDSCCSTRVREHGEHRHSPLRSQLTR